MEFICPGVPGGLDFIRDPHDVRGPEAEPLMLDLFLVAGGIGAFVLAIFYTIACERM
jgi:hypothetical protein